MAQRFHSYHDFYRYYLLEHQDPRCRRLHYLGSLLVLGLVLDMSLRGDWQHWWWLPLAGYGCAWLGHFLFERNRPATLRYPFYSFVSDWIMLKDWLTNQLDHKLTQAKANAAAQADGRSAP
ncbi:DUF962 domain-containing protein [Ferrimonas pelagia]|uniref:DUF962 domain-containing protein n=1 Tax=Ferrimonas pelagia TaxID=1177826 RepID=A0ABP9EKS6_9GAMM